MPRKLTNYPRLYFPDSLETRLGTTCIVVRSRWWAVQMWHTGSICACMIKGWKLEVCTIGFSGLACFERHSSTVPCSLHRLGTRLPVCHYTISGGGQLCVTTWSCNCATVQCPVTFCGYGCRSNLGISKYKLSWAQLPCYSYYALVDVPYSNFMGYQISLFFVVHYKSRDLKSTNIMTLGGLSKNF